MGDLKKTPTGRVKRSDINAAVAALMATQAGRINYRQLLGCGLSRQAVARRVDSKQLVLRSEPKPQPRPTGNKNPSQKAADRRAMTTRVYSAHAGKPTLTERRWEGILSAPDGALLAHVSSCALAGLERPTGRAMHVISVGSGWDAPKGVVSHRTEWMPDEDRTVHEGVPCTRLARSLFDAARDVDGSRLDDLLDTAVRLKIYDAYDMERVLKDRPTVPGAQRMAEAVGRLDESSGRFRSNFERRTMRLVQRSTLIAPPIVNVMLEGFEHDLWFSGTRAIVECDGRDYHRSPAQIAKDALREEILRAKGFVFLRLRWDQVVYEEERALARIERFVLANLDPPVPTGLRARR